MRVAVKCEFLNLSSAEMRINKLQRHSLFLFVIVVAKIVVVNPRGAKKKKTFWIQRMTRKMNNHYLRLALVLLVTLSTVNLADSSRTTSKRQEIDLSIVNHSGKNLVVDWVNPKSGKLLGLGGIKDGEMTHVKTFFNHTFAIREQATNETCINSEDRASSCTIKYITVSEKIDQVAVIKYEEDSSTLAVIEYKEDSATQSEYESQEALKGCKKQAMQDIDQGLDPSNVMKELEICLEDRATALFKKKNDEIAFESHLRNSLAFQMENFTCADPTKETTEPKEVRTWYHDDVNREVLILHDRPASQIHVIKNFISREECQAITKAAEPKLHRGTVADGKGGSRLSDHRKAMQAAIRVPWEKGLNNPIARVSQRLYDYTNDAVGYNLTIEGQEGLMSIQYNGVGLNSNEPPDQYRPHCDGDCDGLPHKEGGRVATMVMYCDVPELGGATNFQHAGVYVKSELGAAAFFSYMDPITRMKETGFTTHSGCPVILGRKRIAVQWMRIGVDDDNPWDSFNTLTIKRKDEEDY